MTSKIIIGDIHGQLAALVKLMEQFPKDFPKKDICFSGDLIDRGPDPIEVMELVRQGGYDMSLGNHEWFLDKSIILENDNIHINHEIIDIWRDPVNGGGPTLQKYMTYQKKLREHVEWIRSLPLYLEYPEVKDIQGRHLVVSHSSITGVWKFRHKNDISEYVLWHRDRKDPDDVPNIYNVFGHTPQKFEAAVRAHWACIDGGGFNTNTPGYGYIYALQYPEKIVYGQRVESTYHERYLKAEAMYRTHDDTDSTLNPRF